jgi:hypothetical protein
MKEIVFNSEQKEILLEFLKRQFDAKYDKSIYHQIYKALKDANKHFFTPTWSRSCWIAVDAGWHIYRGECEAADRYELRTIMGHQATKPKLSKSFELWRDLNERIRIPWNKNATYQIIFQ